MINVLKVICCLRARLVPAGHEKQGEFRALGLASLKDKNIHQGMARENTLRSGGKAGGACPPGCITAIPKARVCYHVLQHGVL